MCFGFTVDTRDKNPLFSTYGTFGVIFFLLKILTEANFVLNTPETMKEKAEVVSISMRGLIGDCEYHETFFGTSFTNVAIL